MLKHIGGKEGNPMNFSTSNLLNNLSNEELLMIAQAGKLEELCYALSLDLETLSNGKNNKDTTGIA